MKLSPSGIYFFTGNDGIHSR